MKTLCTYDNVPELGRNWTDAKINQDIVDCDQTKKALRKINGHHGFRYLPQYHIETDTLTNFVITECTWDGHHDHLKCRQWIQNSQYDHLSGSVHAFQNVQLFRSFCYNFVICFSHADSRCIQQS